MRMPDYIPNFGPCKKLMTLVYPNLKKPDANGLDNDRNGMNNFVATLFG